MSLMNRDDLLGQIQRRYVDAPLPDGRKLRLRSLTDREKSDYENEILTSKGGLNHSKVKAARRRLIVLCAVDEHNEVMLSAADVARLEEVDGAVTSAAYDAARIHCGFEAGDIEGLVKNSELIPDCSSPTD